MWQAKAANNGSIWTWTWIQLTFNEIQKNRHQHQQTILAQAVVTATYIFPLPSTQLRFFCAMQALRDSQGRKKNTKFVFVSFAQKSGWNFSQRGGRETGTKTVHENGFVNKKREQKMFTKTVSLTKLVHGCPHKKPWKTLEKSRFYEFVNKNGGFVNKKCSRKVVSSTKNVHGNFRQQHLFTTFVPSWKNCNWSKNQGQKNSNWLKKVELASWKKK